jgi:hypothetical protein
VSSAAARLMPIEPSSYAVHALHHQGRDWDQTNCAFDVWVEVLHALGLDPVAAAPFCVASDFEGDQWTFFKYPLEDLWTVYGVDAHEMNPWRGDVLRHVVEQLRLGRLMTVEVDSFFLPDTAGVSHGLEHVKSTIVPNAVDVDARTMDYFHNSSFHHLEGDDFDGVWRRGQHAGTAELAPYTEIVRLEHVRAADDAELLARSRALLDRHLDRRPEDNPVQRLARRVLADLDDVAAAGPDAFHDYAFATVRQCGANAETAQAWCEWVAARDADLAAPAEAAGAHFGAVSRASKSVLLKLARVARGRTTDVAGPLEEMAAEWAAAQGLLEKLRTR